MKHEDILEAIQNLVPEAKFVLSGIDYENIEWVDERNKPSLEEVENEIKRLPAKRKKALEEKTAIRQTILDKLNITEEDVRLLLG